MDAEIEDLKHALGRHEQAITDDVRDIKELRGRVEALEIAAAHTLEALKGFYVLFGKVVTIPPYEDYKNLNDSIVAKMMLAEGTLKRKG